MGTFFEGNKEKNDIGVLVFEYHNNYNFPMTESKKVAKPIDVVSEDRNWVIRINNESESEKKWDEQWGYLSQGFNPDRTATKSASLDDKIK